MPRDARPSVLVLSTLHKYHSDVCGYNFEVLRRILASLAIDDVLLEVSDDDLRNRREEQFKREYPEVVYPYLLEHPGTRAHALEPSGPYWQELLLNQRAAAREFQSSPDYASFEVYARSWFRQLLERFQTAADINSVDADEAVREKQEYQRILYPPVYTQCWNEWNQYFYERIVHVVTSAKPALAVALVGLEHSYWLRPRLRERSDIVLLDAHHTVSSL